MRQKMRLRTYIGTKQKKFSAHIKISDLSESVQGIYWIRLSWIVTQSDLLFRKIVLVW